MKRRLSGAVLIALVTVLIVGATPALAFDHSAYEARMLRLVNHARTSRGLHALAVSDPLARAALRHSRDMIAHHYFSHSSLGGATLATRARSAGYRTSGSALGEVIAFGSSFRGTPESVFRSWMRSSAHRQVILFGQWRDAGVGSACGSYRGYSGVVMVTMDFGRRAQ